MFTQDAQKRCADAALVVHRDARNDIRGLATGLRAGTPCPEPIELAGVRVTPDGNIGISGRAPRPAVGMVPGKGWAGSGPRLDCWIGIEAGGRPRTTGRARTGARGAVADCGEGLCEAGAEFDREQGRGGDCNGRDGELSRADVKLAVSRAPVATNGTAIIF